MAESPDAGSGALRWLHVADNGTFREVHVCAGEDTTTALGALVDGHLEHVGTTVHDGEPLRFHRLDIWLNSEGKSRRDLAANPPVMGLVYLSFGDMIVGPVVLAASTPDGVTVGLSDDALGAAKRLLRRFGAAEQPPATVPVAAAEQAAARRDRLAAGYTGHSYGRR